MKEIWIADHGHNSYSTHWTREAACENAASGTKVIRMVPAVEPILYICCCNTVISYSDEGHLEKQYTGIIFNEKGICYDILQADTMNDLHDRLMSRTRDYPGYEIVNYINKSMPRHVAALLATARPASCRYTGEEL